MADLNLLRGLGTVEQFQKGQVVFMENDEGASMYIALKGIFGVYINSFADFPVKVADINQGSFFGEMSLIDNWPRSATIISEDDGMALMVGKDNFGHLLEKSPDIMSGMLTSLRQRAYSTAEKLKQAGKTAPELIDMPGEEGDVAAVMIAMTELSRQLRQMNRLLLGMSDDKNSAPEQNTANARASGVQKLLPDGYSPFNETDANDNSSMLITKKVVCPHCGMRVDVIIPAQSNLVEKLTMSDGRVIYDKFDILLYTNVVCPNCNYTDGYQEFCRFRPASEIPTVNGNAFKNAENFTGFADPKKHTLDETVISYYLRLKCLNAVTSDPLRFAKTWIRLYWIYSDRRREDAAKLAAEKAEHYYSKYLDNNSESLTTYDLMCVHVMLAELSMCQEKYADALWYYEQNTKLGKNHVNRQVQDLVRESLAQLRQIKAAYM